jgi:hypothetical protein
VAAQLFLNEAKFLEFEVEVPNERWFRHQRKSLGCEACLYDNWELFAEDDKPWFDFFCGNHTRNLPMDAFNKVRVLSLTP